MSSCRSSSPVLRKNSRGKRFKPVLVMEPGENWFFSNAMSLRNVVAGGSCPRPASAARDRGTKARVRPGPDCNEVPTRLGPSADAVH